MKDPMDTPYHYTRGVTPRELEIIQSAISPEEFQSFLEETIIRVKDYPYDKGDEEAREKLLFYRGHDI